MLKTDTSQKILNWLNNEKKKDDLEIKSYKEKFIKEIKSKNKEDFFVKNKVKKLTLWQKLKIMIWGY